MCIHWYIPASFAFTLTYLCDVMTPLKVVTRELVRDFVRSLMVLENILNGLSFGMKKWVGPRGEGVGLG